MTSDRLDATVSVHIVTLRWHQAWRAPVLVRRGRQLGGAHDVRFAVCGRTSGGGGLRHINRTLSLRRMIVLAEWVSPDAAIEGRRSVDTSWQRIADVWSALLVPMQSKGTFNGAAAFAANRALPDTGVVASVTYAQVRPSKMWNFYVRSFPKTARRATNPDSAMLAGVGFGDVPVRHACTFSLWPSNHDVAQFAYSPTDAHGPVQAQSRRDDWLSESLFARFAVTEHGGTWAGQDPLTPTRA
jgi:hypothetical protein